MSRTAEKDASDFVWCDVRDWVQGHVCANNKPGHVEHACCCGYVFPPAKGDAQ